MNTLIKNSPNKAFFEFLLRYENPKAAAYALEKLKAKELPKGHIMLKNWLDLSDYGQLDNLEQIDPDFNKDYAVEIAEMGRLIDLLVSELKHKALAEKLASILFELLNQAGIHIENSAKGYSQGKTIPANVWMDGAAIRDWALYMAIYYEDLKKYEQETQMRFIRCKITNNIMSHYKHLVGPDMIGVGKSLEKINLQDRAFMFYNAVILDFAALLSVHSNSEEINEEDKLSLWALKEAYEGILRLGKSTEVDKDEMRVMLLSTILS